MVTSVTNIQVTKGGHDFTYHEYDGLSTDTKPTTGVFNGSKFIESDSGKVLKFSGATLQWIPIKFAEWRKPIASAPLTNNHEGDVVIDPDTSKIYMWRNGQWKEI